MGERGRKTIAKKADNFGIFFSSKEGDFSSCLQACRALMQVGGESYKCGIILMDEVVARINRGGFQSQESREGGLIGKWWCEVIALLGYFRRRKGALGLTRGCPSNPTFRIWRMKTPSTCDSLEGHADLKFLLV